MKSKVLKYVFIVSMAGFLFGFDTVVISGVNLPLKELWQTSGLFHGTFIISISLWGTVLGSLWGGYPTEKLGRKTTLIWIGILYTVSALGAAIATGPYLFSFFRFIGGVSAGVASIAAPSYITEISEAKNRGRMGMLFQFNLVFGILMAYVSNYLLVDIAGSDSWRYMLGIELIPAVIYSVLVLIIPESPRWLIVHKKDLEQAKKVLSTSSSEPEKIIEGIVKEEQKHSKGEGKLFSGKYNRVLILSFLIAFFNQFSGISFILFYAPEILEKAGLGTTDSLLSSVSIGLVNLFFTFIGISLIDKLGRKQLMYIGSVGYIISLAMTAVGFYNNYPATFMLVSMLLFITSHAIGQGAVIWVFISEIFPNKVRSYGQSWGSGLLNIFAAIITLFGAVVISQFSPEYIFAIFCFFMVLQLLYTHYMMPETKGVSLEELEEKLSS
ncbi:sugar porter family MFS transporter [Fulvivirga ligni]|uniref:sugar porter family MFS transporter n=1 Tax=Fulvivirga ligni TaxID=2904246 RepID=UPI001F1D7985|nr:sugar porter family MFS transporter [Fulvivirga ligni]UII19537.1 sugar porter family MFS transporter [Fulvivirga ligni]